jgi:hypothetical protein
MDIHNLYQGQGTTVRFYLSIQTMNEWKSRQVGYMSWPVGVASAYIIGFISKRFDSPCRAG